MDLNWRLSRSTGAIFEWKYEPHIYYTFQFMYISILMRLIEFQIDVFDLCFGELCFTDLQSEENSLRYILMCYMSHVHQISYLKLWARGHLKCLYLFSQRWLYFKNVWAECTNKVGLLNIVTPVIFFGFKWIHSPKSTLY